VGLICEAELSREASKRVLTVSNPFERLAHAETIAVVGQRQTGVSAEGPTEMLWRNPDVSCERWQRRCQTRRQRLADPVDRLAPLLRDARATRRPV
jgi:hypothetical protein